MDWQNVTEFATEQSIDSRDVQTRIEELESILEDEENPAQDDDLADLLKTLREFRDDADSDEWPHGIRFIADRHFVDYAQELAENIGAIPKDNSWPCTCIDWEQAAKELQMDYTSIHVGDSCFWYRA